MSEILFTKTPSILIPLPIAFLDEQRENALFAEKFGIARIIDQNKLSKTELLKEVDKLDKDWKFITSRVKFKKSPDKNAAKKLVDILSSLLKDSREPSLARMN